MKNGTKLLLQLGWLAAVTLIYALCAVFGWVDLYSGYVIFLLVFHLSFTWFLGSLTRFIAKKTKRPAVVYILGILVCLPLLAVLLCALVLGNQMYMYAFDVDVRLPVMNILLCEGAEILRENTGYMLIVAVVYILGGMGFRRLLGWALEYAANVVLKVLEKITGKQFFDDDDDYRFEDELEFESIYDHGYMEYTDFFGNTRYRSVYETYRQHMYKKWECTSDGGRLHFPKDKVYYVDGKRFLATRLSDFEVLLCATGFPVKGDALELEVHDNSIDCTGFEEKLGIKNVNAEEIIIECKGDIAKLTFNGLNTDLPYVAEFERWVTEPSITPAERQELIDISENHREVESRFFAPLSFGTAGLRGELGMGINRMNVYTVRQATQGMANLIKGLGKKACERGVAIAMDCRNMSDVFAREAACVLAGNKIKVYLFESLRPTPELSFAIRTIGCIAGINITASHNPKEYNGYKAYWEDGAQLPPEPADVVAAEIAKTDIFRDIITMDYNRALDKGRIILIGEEVDESFLHHAQEMAINRSEVEKAAEDFKVVYTPFHGTGHKLVPEILRRIGLKNIICVPEQMVIDGDFPTVKSPNPENKEGFAQAIELAKQNNVDLIIGTDPDADRVGVIVRDEKGEYIPITGNQMGVLLLDYIIRAKKETGTMPENPAAIKTIVTTEMVRAVCAKHGVEVFDTFTGFKFMAEKIKLFERRGSYEYLLAFEESYGYLVGGYCRDKDAVTASMLIAEMAAYYHNRGKSLYDALQQLYAEYGFYMENTVNIVMPGVDGLEKMRALMERLRNEPPQEIGGVKVCAVRDYLSGEKTNLYDKSIKKMELSGSNVLYFELEDATSFIIRPSGTEPKIKVYVLANGRDADECTEKIERYTLAAKSLG